MAISITKPTVGGSEDTWGTTINTALDTIVDAVNGTSGTVAPDLSTLTINGTDYTGTASELNTLADNYDHYVPAGGIIMWSGAISAIPTGWVLCDGTNSTPNLVDRFIIGSGTDSGGTHDVGDTGGSNSITLAEENLPAHTHDAGTLATGAAGSHNHTYDRLEQGSPYALQDGGVLWGYDSASTTSTEPDHTHTISGDTGSTGSGSSIDNRPAYYALAFIMKT